MPDFDGELREHSIIKNQDTNEERVEAIRIGPTNTRCTPFIVNHNSHQMYQGMYKRVIHAMKKPNKKVINRFYKFVAQQISQLQPLPPIERNKETLEQWLSIYDRPQSRKDQIRRAFDNRADGHLFRKDYRCKMFIKREFYGDYKYARMINPRSDEFVAQVAPYIHKIDEYIYKESPFGRYFIKGKTPEQIVEALKERFAGQACILETDYSSFEGSFSQDYQKHVEWRVFKRMLQNNREILELIRPCYHKRNVLYNPFMTCSFEGSRMSGDMWTSSMNGFSNLMNMLFLAHELDVTVDGFVEGDDGIFHLSKPVIKPEHYADLGFTIKLDYVSSVNDAAFCQKTALEGEKTLIGPPQCLSKAGWTCATKYRNMRENRRFELYKAVCMSYYYLYNGCPLLGPSFYHTLQHLSKTKANWNSCDWWWREQFEGVRLPDYVEPSYQARVLYEVKYGVTVEEQLRIERQFSEKLTDYELDLPNTPTYTEGIRVVLS